MKKAFTRSLSIFLILLVVSFTISYADAQRYVDKNFGFSITPPDGWEIKDGRPYKVAIIFIGPMEGGFRVNFNINVVAVPGVTNIDDDLISEIKKALETSIGIVDFISEGEIKVSKYEGYEITYIIEFAEDLFLMQKQIYVINNGKAYIFTFTSSEETSEKYLPLFEESLKSFEIL